MWQMLKMLKHFEGLFVKMWHPFMIYHDRKKWDLPKNSSFLFIPFRLQPHHHRRQKTRAHEGTRRLKCILLTLHYSVKDFTLLLASLPRPFYVLGEMKTGGGSPPTTQCFHLRLRRGRRGWGWGGGWVMGESLASSCSDAAQHQRWYDTIRAYLFMILYRHVLQFERADWEGM